MSIAPMQNIYRLLRDREITGHFPKGGGSYQKQNWIYGNITDSNCTEIHIPRIFDDNNKIRAIAIRDQYAALLSDSVHLWDLERRKCLWTKAIMRKVEWKEEYNITFEIVDNTILYANEQFDFAEKRSQKIFRLLHLKTGEMHVQIENSKLVVEKIQTIGQRIFMPYYKFANWDQQSLNIGEWNLEGAETNTHFLHLTRCDCFNSKFAVSEEHLVETTNTTLKIICLGQQGIKRLAVPQPVASLYIDGDQLVCGYRVPKKPRKGQKLNHIAIVNLKKCAIERQYTISREEGEAQGSVSVLEKGYIKQVINKGDWIYLRHNDQSDIFALNKVTCKNRHIASDYGLGCLMKLKGHLLAFRSIQGVHLWDTRTQQMMATFSSSYLMRFSASKIVTKVTQEFIIRDFDVAHKGTKSVTLQIIPK